jgi:hypothetical protein
MMRKVAPIVCLIVLALFTISCGQLADVFENISSQISDSDTSDTSGDKPGDDSQPPPDAPPPAVPTGCDAPAEPVALNTVHSLQMHSTTAGYPANCLYYCVEIPGGSDLDISISGFNIDLDLYVGFGSIASVQGEEPVWGESYDWLSNEFGTVDEHVSVPSPRAGVYYIEVCSYEGEASSFRLEASTR